MSISRGETQQPIHNNQKIGQASGGTTRREASGWRITRREGRGGQRKASDQRPRPVSADPTHNNQLEKQVGGGQHDEMGGWTHEARVEGTYNGKAIGWRTTQQEEWGGGHDAGRLGGGWHDRGGGAYNACALVVDSFWRWREEGVH